MSTTAVTYAGTPYVVSAKSSRVVGRDIVLEAGSQVHRDTDILPLHFTTENLYKFIEELISVSNLQVEYGAGVITIWEPESDATTQRRQAVKERFFDKGKLISKTEVEMVKHIAKLELRQEQNANS